MVIFRRPEGKPGYHQAENVEDALRFVEMLRNQEQVTDARIFRMQEVPIEVRTVYKVELVTAGANAGAEAPSNPAPSNQAPMVAQTPPTNPEPANGDAAVLGPQEVF